MKISIHVLFAWRVFYTPPLMDALNGLLTFKHVLSEGYIRSDRAYGYKKQPELCEFHEKVQGRLKVFRY